MANLLPSNNLKSVWSMYRARFVIAGALVLLACACLAALALMPSYLALRFTAAPAPVSDPIQGSPLDAIDVLRAQALVQAIHPLMARATTTDAVIQEALSLRPAGILITHIALTAGEAGKMTLGGTGSRDGISAYRDALGADPYFTSVSVPVGALVGAEDGQFSITLEGSF